MKRLAIGTLAALLTATTAQAGPLTTGTWTALPGRDLEVHKSEDDGCATGPGKCAAVWYLPAQTQVLVGGFGYDGWPGGTLVARQTEYTGGSLNYDGTSWAYDNAHGFSTSSWGGTHQMLYRHLTDTGTQYWLAIEDLPSPFYFDFNDYFVTWFVENPTVPPCTGDCDPPTQVPEPLTLGLFGVGLLAAVRRRR